MQDEELIEPPSPRVFLIAGGYTGIVAPGECGCRLDDLMPCGISSLDCDGATGIPRGCLPGYVHNDPSGKTLDWIASTKKEPPTQDDFGIVMSAA